MHATGCMEKSEDSLNCWSSASTLFEAGPLSGVHHCVRYPALWLLKIFLPGQVHGTSAPGFQTQALTIAWQVIHPWSLLPSPFSMRWKQGLTNFVGQDSNLQYSI